MRLQGLIAAAGMSSRMDGFKPLMELNGFPMIRMTVQSLKNAGIRDITVVTGCRHREMEAVLLPLGVQVVENRAYRETDMFASFRLGLSRLLEKAETDAVFFLPGDIPLVSPESMGRMKQGVCRAAGDTEALLPMADGNAAHPPVILAGGCEKVLRYGGEGGLRGAFARMRTEPVELSGDPGALADADYRRDFEKLTVYAKKHKGVSEGICERWYEEAGLPEPARRYGRSVGRLAGWMAERLVESGICLDVELCRSGGYVCGFSGGGDMAGAFLRVRGYEALAELAGGDRWSGREPETVCREDTLVYLAGKLSRGDPDFQKMSPVGDRILGKGGICERLLKEFEVMTGERL